MFTHMQIVCRWCALPEIQALFLQLSFSDCYFIEITLVSCADTAGNQKGEIRKEEGEGRQSQPRAESAKPKRSFVSLSSGRQTKHGIVVPFGARTANAGKAWKRSFVSAKSKKWTERLMVSGFLLTFPFSLFPFLCTPSAHLLHTHNYL